MSGSAVPPRPSVATASPASDEVRELRFGDVAIDPRAGVVRRRGVALALRPKAYDVLLYFARRPGRLMSRLEVLDAVWPDVTVTDDSLVQCLVEIRRTLGDAAPITTVRGRGYRFDTAVEAVTEIDRDVDLAVSELASATATPTSADQRRPPPSHRDRAGWGHDWRVSGGAVALVAMLGLVAWRVADHGSVAGRRDIGRPLGAESLDRDAIRLHDEGRVLYERQTRVATLHAVERFEAAARLDPEYAGAWAGLSQALTRLHIYGSASSPTVLPRAKVAALRAVALDPTLGNGHAALAHVLEQYDRDWAGAEASHRRAIALNPKDAGHRIVHALFLVSRLRPAEALAEMDRARSFASDPARAIAMRGVVLMYAGRPVEALASLDEVRRQSPSRSVVEYFRAFVLVDLGRFDEALATANAATVDAGNEPTLLVGIVHALAGRRTEALEVRKALEQKAATGYVPATDFAMLAAALGEHDEAVRWLERGADEHSRGMASINVHPVLRRLRPHPRYVALLRRLDLPLP